MRVVACPAVEQIHDDVGPVVAVGVFEPDEPRLIGDEHAAVPELEPSRAVELVVKHLAAIGAAIAIMILENQQPIGRPLVARLPQRVRGHAANPQPAAVIEVELVGLGQLGEFFFTGEGLHLEALRHLHRFDALFRREILQLLRLRIILLRIAEPRDGDDELAGGTVVG